MTMTITTAEYKKLKRIDLLKIRKNFSGSKSYNHEKIMGFENENVCPILKASNKVICGYYPMTNGDFHEIDILPLLKYLATNNTILLPKIIKGSRILEFGEVDFTQNLQKQLSTDNSYGIQEPIHTLNKDILHIDYMLIPALGMDKNFHRMGYGGGYYDNTLSFYKSINESLVSIGICLNDCYLAEEEFQTNEYDVPLSAILTDQNFCTNNFFTNNK